MVLRAPESRRPSGEMAPDIGEFWHLMHETKKYWLLPIIVVCLLFGGMLLLSGTAAAPFIYTLF